MKKSQILAALALAFALGVVAPVAGASAVESRVADTTQKTTATEQEVKNAIANIENNATYKNYAAVAQDVKNITDAKIGDASATAYADVDAAKAGLTAAATTVKIGYNTNDSLSAVIATVETNANYKLWANLIEKVATAENVVDQTVKEGDVFTNLFNAMKAIKSSIVLEDDDDLAALITDAKSLALTGDQSYATYANYTTLYSTLKKASKTSQLDGAIREDLAKIGVSANQIKNATTLTALSALAAGANNYNAWSALATAVGAAKKTDFAASTPTALYGIIDKAGTGLLQLLQAADSTKDYTVADLIGAAPVLPENPDNKPEDDDKPGDNNGDDQKDPSAPGTGVLSSADGNAATTVSIVAGLATALTALGAGVVAYRSARRSNK